MLKNRKLCAGEWVEVRCRDEILATLDRNGQLDGLPFMPEMFAFCGRRFRVYKRAHKTCDTITGECGGLRMREAVHLEGIRCDGQSHGGCEARCLIFWKEAWLRRAAMHDDSGATYAAEPTRAASSTVATSCTESDVVRATTAPNQQDVEEPVYVCQATQLLTATEPLSKWNVKQYLEDYNSGNISLVQMANGFIYMSFKWLADRVAGRFLHWLYDSSTRLRGGFKYPRKRGTIPVGAQTPSTRLDLQPGELVRVKTYEQILATCDKGNKNRGLKFDAELVPFCGGTYRVLKRVTKILDEKTGKMQRMKSPCLILEDVFCEARYSECRLFCPRSIYSYWREIWLERVEEPRSMADRDSSEGRGREDRGVLTR